MKGVVKKTEGGFILGIILISVVCIAEIFLNNIYIIIISITAEGVLMYSLYLYRKQKRTEKEQKMQVLEEQNENLYWFKRILAHNIRMPLSIMLGYEDYLIKHGEFQKKDREFMETIYKNMLYVKEVLSQTLDQEEEGQFQKYDLTECVYEVMGYIKKAAQKTGVTITIHAVGGMVIPMNKIQILHLLYNLFENSIKYMGRPGKIQITITSMKHQVLFLYQDNGKGMEAEIVKHIFEKGYRGDREKEGSGLGMYLVYYVVKGHGGNIEVESMVNKGIKVSIYFPIAF